MIIDTWEAEVVKPKRTRICLYPIKSLHGVVVASADSPGGSLAFDRRWRRVDLQGPTGNGKPMVAVHRVPARLDAQRQLMGFDLHGGNQPQM